MYPKLIEELLQVGPGSLGPSSNGHCSAVWVNSIMSFKTGFDVTTHHSSWRWDKSGRCEVPGRRSLPRGGQRHKVAFHISGDI